MTQVCIVVVGGDAPDPPRRPLPRDAFVVAADSGVDHALGLGLRVDVAVGDFDSVSPNGLDVVTAAGARIERHPAAKDHTDLELALDTAMATGCSDLIVLGGDGGRLDHLLANALVIASPRYSSCTITAYLGPAEVHVAHGGRPPVRLDVAPGDLVTLLPVHGSAADITTTGLRFGLCNETLLPATTRGVSNVVESSPATVALATGTVLVVLPGEREEGTS